jgi:hypothetical protein
MTTFNNAKRQAELLDALDMTHAASGAFEIDPKKHPAIAEALDRDAAWLRANPTKTRLRRRVEEHELMPNMRGKNVVEVTLERAGPSLLLQNYFNAQGQPVFMRVVTAREEILPSAPTRGIETLYDPIKGTRQLAVDRADVLGVDQNWFREHPGRNEYERAPLTSELATARALLGTLPKHMKIRVRQVRPNYLVRQFMVLTDPAPPKS